MLINNYAIIEPAPQYPPPKPTFPPAKVDPCQNTPCGQNAYCKIFNGKAACFCNLGYFGDPTTACRPECVQSSDCADHQECRSLKCVDPCVNFCGINAQCRCTAHVATCTCIPGYHGDPYSQCAKGKRPVLRLLPKAYCDSTNVLLLLLEPIAKYPPPTPVYPPPRVPSYVDPCANNPCGPYSECRVRDGAALCSCLQGYFGTPCRPECMRNSECANNRACISQRCVDPCVSVCGLNAECHVVQHVPVCTCLPFYEGDPFTVCEKRRTPTIPKQPPPQIRNPCQPNPCGDNAQCTSPDGVTSVCQCLPNYFGNPVIGCRPECVLNSDCPYDRACLNYKCVSVCEGTCGVAALCRVHNHVPTCSCPEGYNGDPFVSCSKVEYLPPARIDPCQPNPCGPYSQCRSNGDSAVCSCLESYFGSPPNCRPECLVDSDCSMDKSCIQQRCVNPCQGKCGQYALCHVRFHTAYCSCPERFEGNPLVLCSRIPEPVVTTQAPVPRNPCIPSPCGANAECRPEGQRAVCSCQPNFFGSPPYCRPECTISAECPQTKACVNQRCVSPCDQSVCGLNAQCHVINHAAVCVCLDGYRGDAFAQCHKIPGLFTGQRIIDKSIEKNSHLPFFRL